MSSNQEHPSLVGGHAKYVEGAISSALGYESGERTKEEAVQQMKAANAGNADNNNNTAPAQSGVLGTVEKKVGELTGCEGMEKEGAQRIPRGSEETSGTG